MSDDQPGNSDKQRLLMQQEAFENLLAHSDNDHHTNKIDQEQDQIFGDNLTASKNKQQKNKLKKDNRDNLNKFCIYNNPHSGTGKDDKAYKSVYGYILFL